MKLIKYFYILVLFAGSIANSANARWESQSSPWTEVKKRIEAENPDIPRTALNRAFDYLIANPDLVENTHYMTVINFDLPSTAERMYVIDLGSLAVQTYLVAHGKASGDNYATHFSNQINSYMSSLGIYLTGDPYVGVHGLSMRLRGMETTNSNAETRSIVLHGADYVSQDWIDQYGRLGRSEGCPAVSMQFSAQLVQELSGGSVFLIYKSRRILNPPSVNLLTLSETN